MGFFSDIFSIKEKIWQGRNIELYEKYCEALRSNGFKIQAFKINQERPKCTGNCAACAACGDIGEDVSFYDKLGSGCSDDLLTAKNGDDIYAIYVKQKDLEKAQQVLTNIRNDLS